LRNGSGGHGPGGWFHSGIHGRVGGIKTVLTVSIRSRIRRAGTTRKGGRGAHISLKSNQIGVTIVIGLAMSLTLLQRLAPGVGLLGVAKPLGDALGPRDTGLLAVGAMGSVTGVVCVQLEQRLQAPPELARWEPMEPILPEDVLLPMVLAVAIQQWAACQVGKWVRLVVPTALRVVWVHRWDRSNNQSSRWDWGFHCSLEQ
jgi:hypothetical protein